MKSSNGRLFGILALVCISLSLISITSAQGFLRIKNGYFWDPKLNSAWFAKGMAYQTWIADLGEWQTDEQIEYDLREMKKLGVNSIRVDFVWKHIEQKGDNQFEWSRYDHLVRTAEKYKLRIFALVGYQWPPDWFPGKLFEEGNNVDPGWLTMHPPGPEPAPPFTPTKKNYTQLWTSDIMSFEHPQGRLQYQEWLMAVGRRYKDSTAIAGWIIGNEFGYIGLWSYRQDGYDPSCQAAFRAWCQTTYNNDIAAANAVWGTNFASFAAIKMPLGYNRNNKLWADVVQWREDSVAGFLASGAAALKSVDPNHMLSYATVGMIWGPEDWRYHAEDTGKIADACKAAGAPLSFMSINNYPNGMAGDELRSGKWGFRYATWKTKLPVLLTETGFTATEDLFPVKASQGALLTTALWEAALAGGAVGIHVFHWNYRPWLTTREQGFGIVSADRLPSDTVASFKLMLGLLTQYQLDTKFIPGSKDAKADIGFYWTADTDQMYNRYQANMQAIWGPLERLGFEPRFVSREEIRSGDYKNLSAIVLPRNQRMEPGDLLYLKNNVLANGVHLFADADLPGMQSYHIQPNTDFNQRMLDTFGVEVAQANAYEDAVVEYTYGVARSRVDIKTVNTFGALPAAHSDYFWVWKYHKLINKNATTLATMTLSDEGWAQEHPGIVIKKHPKAKAALTSFALGELCPSGIGPWAPPDQIPWSLHSNWFGSIFTSATGFALKPSITVVGSPFVMADQRVSVYPGTIFMTVLNWSDDTTETATITNTALKGKTIVNMYTNRVVETNSDGKLTLTLTPNQLFVFKASPGGPKASVKIMDHPTEVWPVARPYVVTVNYDVATYAGKQNSILLEFRTSAKVFSQTITPLADAAGQININIDIPSASLTYAAYRSSDAGNNYYFRVALRNTAAGTTTAVATTTLPTLLSFGIKPTGLPTTLPGGAVRNTRLNWENLDPLSRIHAFPGRVLVYYSSKTAAVAGGWSQGEKVGMVTTWLESMGYVFSYLGPLEEPKKRIGPTYFQLSDDMTCEWGLCGGTANDGKLYNLNADYLIRYFKTVILVGTWVMNDQETNNLIAFMNAVPDAKIIATEGGVGRLRPDGSNGESRLASLFGMGPAPAYSVVDFNTVLTVSTTAVHPINRNFLPGASTPLPKASIPLLSRTGSYVWPQVLPGAVSLGTFTADGANFPALVVNQYGLGSTFLFNADLTIYQQLNSTVLKPLTNAFNDWMVLGDYINKATWQMSCKATGQIFATTSIWVLTGTGNGTASVTLPATIPCAVNTVKYTAIVHPWNAANPWNSRIAAYASP